MKNIVYRDRINIILDNKYITSNFKNFTTVKLDKNLFSSNGIIENQELYKHELSKIIDKKNKIKEINIIIPDFLTHVYINEINDIENISVDEYINLHFEKLTNNSGISFNECYYDYDIVIKEKYTTLTLAIVKKEIVDFIEEPFLSLGIKVYQLINRSFLIKNKIENKEIKKTIYVFLEENNTNYIITDEENNKIKFELKEENLTLKNFVMSEKNLNNSSNKKNESHKEEYKNEESISIDLDIGININLNDDIEDNSNTNIKEVKNNEDISSKDMFVNFIYVIQQDIEDKLQSIGNNINDYDIIYIVDKDCFMNKNNEIELKTKFNNISFIDIFEFLSKSKSFGNLNLHNWREELKNIKKQSFFKKLGLISILSVSVAVLMQYNLNNKIIKQKNINGIYNAEIKKDEELKIENEKLKNEKKEIETRIKTINGLEVERPNIINVFSSLVNSIPKEIYLQTLIRNDNKTIKVHGISTDNNQILNFVKTLEKSKFVYNVMLSSVNLNEKEQYFEFDITMSEKEE